MFSLRTCLLIIVAMLSMGIIANEACACPTCKEAVIETQDHLTLGYYWSILFMMAMPFTLFAAWTIIILQLRRKMKLQSLALVTPGGNSLNQPASRSSV